MSQDLNELQTDTITELANMAINRAAGKLSELTDRPVELSIPQIRYFSSDMLEHFLLNEAGPNAPCINQHFEGAYTGDAILTYPGNSAAQLAALLLEEEKDIDALSEMEYSALIEVGNILINAFMGMISEVVETPFDFSIPQMFMPSKEVVQDILGKTMPADQDTKIAVLLDSEIAISGTSIAGNLAFLTDLTLDTDLTFEQRECLNMVKSSADSLLRIINDILDFSKIEAGKLEFEHIPFSLRDALGFALKTLELRTCEKRLKLVSEIQSDLPDTLIGDPVRLQQIVINLVGNAIKFTDSGSVTVRAGHQFDD